MRAIDRVIDAIRSALPGARVEQLQVKFPGADDDGLWFVNHPDSEIEVNIESSTGEPPFLIESSRNDARVRASDLDAVIAAVATALGLPAVNSTNSGSSSLEVGKLRAWVEERAIHITARDRPTDAPVELTAAEARRLADGLLKMAGQLQG
jgi:hypothetical protein